MLHRSGRKSAAQTPAPKADQIKGSSVNAEGSASSELSASDIKLSDSTVDVLKKKYAEFREKYPRKKNITLNDLKAVYRRGSGAYSKSHRPTISGGKPNSRAAWSYARVNKFLEKAAGEPVKKAYVQDDDLIKFKEGGSVDIHWYRKYKGDNPFLFDENAKNKYGAGIYFHSAKNSRFEGENEIEVKVNYNNPKVFESTKSIPNLNFIKSLNGKTVNEYAKSLFEEGYDAILVKHSNDIGDELILIDSSIVEIVNRYEEGAIMYSEMIALPDTYSTYENLKPILQNQGYTLNKNKGGQNMEQIVESLLESVYPLVKEIFNKNGLIINESYAFTDGSNKSYLPYFSCKRTDDKIDEVKILYFEQEFEVAGELNIETKDDKIEIEVEFPRWNIDAEVEFAEGGQVNKKIVGYEVEYEKVVEGERERDIKSFNNKEDAEKFAKENYSRVDNVYEGQYDYDKGGRVEEVSERFSLRNAETLSMVTGNVSYILSQYASRKMAAIQVHQYLSEIELGSQWLSENNIKSRGELVSFLGKMQSKARSGRGLERTEALEQMQQEKAEMTVDEIISLAVSAVGGQQINCVNCNWSWNTVDSDESDKYVCHQCGFDNTLFYDNDIIKPNFTIEEIAKKQGVAVEYVREQLEIGANHEMEHTTWYSIAQRIALHHLAEDIEYYQKLKAIHLKHGGNTMEIINADLVEEFEVAAYLMQQRAEADDVLHCSDSRIFKTMICKTKIEVANRRMQNTQDPEEKNVWNECSLIWSDCLNNIVENNIPVREYKDGGQPCGCSKLYLKKGGLAYGNSHDNDGIPLEVKSTGQKIEIEGGEGVVNKVSMQMDEKLEFEGKELTPCEVVSKINEMGGGVKFKCADVKEIIENDGNF